ncbi:MAG: low molecular weight protein-tyrosine-phosphatase [Eubacteriales bacterium]|nr:low molecular weight protein-tyrosine-phosphatase [Eubacteriales bacterium]
MIKILFVCHGNICRSPMAEFIMKKCLADQSIENLFFIDSAATTREEIGNDIYPPAKRKLTEMKIPFARRAARQMVRSDYSRYDYIIGMDEENLYDMRRICGGDPDRKISLLLDWAKRKGSNVADPWYTGNFDVTYNDILEGCTALIASLTNI